MDVEDVEVEVEAAAEEKFMVATIVVAVVEQVGDRMVGEDEPLESTPQALADLQEASPENLLSLELIWAPETGNRYVHIFLYYVVYVDNHTRTHTLQPDHLLFLKLIWAPETGNR
jgi:hypothetical protein